MLKQKEMVKVSKDGNVMIESYDCSADFFNKILCKQCVCEQKYFVFNLLPCEISNLFSFQINSKIQLWICIDFCRKIWKQKSNWEHFRYSNDRSIYYHLISHQIVPYSWNNIRLHYLKTRNWYILLELDSCHVQIRKVWLHHFWTLSRGQLKTFKIICWYLVIEFFHKHFDTWMVTFTGSNGSINLYVLLSKWWPWTCLRISDFPEHS